MNKKNARHPKVVVILIPSTLTDGPCADNEYRMCNLQNDVKLPVEIMIPTAGFGIIHLLPSVQPP
jgi:hypothetical protein